MDSLNHRSVETKPKINKINKIFAKLDQEVQGQYLRNATKFNMTYENII